LQVTSNKDLAFFAASICSSLNTSMILASFFEFPQLIVLNVGSPALWEAEHKERPIAPLVENDRAEATRCTFSLAGKPLLDHSSTKISIDQSLFGVLYRFAQCRVVDARFLTSCEDKHFTILAATWRR